MPQMKLEWLHILHPTTPCFGMSNEHNRVFVLGAAGYIGGAILVGYKKAFPTFHYTALIRNKDYIPAFEGERDDACKSATI